MTISSINSNLASLLAQVNIGNATTATSNDVSALSSGNRITSAATDVAALAAGTGLASQVNVLTSSIADAAQGSSLLQVADGGLAQIQSILQRQQAIATSAESGSLSATQLGFLNQEFQALTTEINNIANQTNFNGVSLLNGGIAGANTLQTANNASAQAYTITGTSTNADVTAAATFATVGTANDTTFYGALSGGTFTVKTDVTATNYDISYSINGSTYSTANTGAFADGGAGTATLSNGVGTITLHLASLAAPSAGNDLILQNNLNSSFAGATAYSVRQILSAADATSPTTGAKIANSAIVAAASNGEDSTNGSLLAGFTGANVVVQSALFNGINAPSISGFSANVTGTTANTLSLQLNGQTYTTGAISGTTTNVVAATFAGSNTAGYGVFYLNGNTSSNEQVTIDFAALSDTHIDLTTTNGTTSLINALNNVFGGGGNGLTFQVGTSASNTIGVTLASSTSSTLFANVTQDVLSQGDATTAGNAVQAALNTVTAYRATVGANEEQFNFATSALTSAQQNESAAKSALLDTDVAATSTTFATNQVQLQAGIAVLAQANQLQQNLLKLLP